MVYALVIALGAAAIVVAGALRCSVRGTFALSMAHRTPLNETDFASLFPGAEESAIAVRQVVAVYVPGDGTLIRPFDRIVKDLMVGANDGLDTNEIVAVLERRFTICIPDARASEVRTVQELIELVQSLRDGNLIDYSIEAPAERQH